MAAEMAPTPIDSRRDGCFWSMALSSLRRGGCQLVEGELGQLGYDRTWKCRCGKLPPTRGKDERRKWRARSKSSAASACSTTSSRLTRLNCVSSDLTER